MEIEAMINRMAVDARWDLAQLADKMRGEIGRPPPIIPSKSSAFHDDLNAHYMQQMALNQKAMSRPNWFAMQNHNGFQQEASLSALLAGPGFPFR